MSDPIEMSYAFGRGVRAVRKARGVSLESFGQQHYIASTTLSSIERGKTGATLTTALIISMALELSINELIEIGTKTMTAKDKARRCSNTDEPGRTKTH